MAVREKRPNSWASGPIGEQRAGSLRASWRRERSATRNILYFRAHPSGRMLQGSRFECRSGQPGRTLWCLGAPTRTCCGVTQGVKLRGQRRRAASLKAERGQGRRGRLKYVKARRARHSEAAKEADRPQPKGDVGRTVGPVSADGSTRMSHRAIEPSLPTTHLGLDQLGKPHGPRPARAVSRPRGRGTGQGVEDAGESEGRPVIGRIGRCPSRKGADFRRVSPKAMPLPRRTCRDVRR